MAKQKIEMPAAIFDEQPPGAIEKLTGSAPRRAAPAPEPAPTPGTQAPAKAERKIKPTSFYLPPDQLKKLDDLAYTYNGRTGKRINRNDVVRHLVKTADMGSLQGL